MHRVLLECLHLTLLMTNTHNVCWMIWWLMLSFHIAPCLNWYNPSSPRVAYLKCPVDAATTAFCFARTASHSVYADACISSWRRTAEQMVSPPMSFHFVFVAYSILPPSSVRSFFQSSTGPPESFPRGETVAGRAAQSLKDSWQCRRANYRWVAPKKSVQRRGTNRNECRNA